ncbi:mechanosensitive ion channel family protein [Hymenobacter chitinivorans]|uniref:Small-conductance mechanosensitive channel n=1 Tax=Hymenobacter chitinivorans DSM 11115 TaxID=1121954 RepID=A0A2M9BRZ6_9BACT|nr:mechanosensitive ion channel domain-containing protein [Hymenobacter chitinivorans]PJJ60707.1 small-conductance mechanosensitive channel [Hymenobacter chitinivorans DSM 11115]
MFSDLQRVLNTYWQQFLYISPKLLIAFIVLILAIFVANHLSSLIGGKLRKKSHDPLMADFLTRFSKWALILAGAVLAMEVVGLYAIVGGVVAGAGLSAFIVGFALKDIAENFLAGVVLAFNRPFHIHDTVQIKDLVGKVEDLSLRVTLIKTFDGKHIFLPNAMVLREPLINFTRDGYIRQDFLVTVDFGEQGNSQHAADLLLRYVQTNRGVEEKEPHTPYVILEKATATTADLRAYFWAYSEDYRRGTLELKSELMRDVKAGLVEEGYAVQSVVQ